MPTGGLSLLGFMEQHLALHYLTTSCIVADTSPTALLQHWNDARRRLGPPDSRVGVPDIQDIPAPHSAHLQQLAAHPRLLKYPAGTVGIQARGDRPVTGFSIPRRYRTVIRSLSWNPPSPRVGRHGTRLLATERGAPPDPCFLRVNRMCLRMTATECASR